MSGQLRDPSAIVSISTKSLMLVHRSPRSSMKISKQFSDSSFLFFAAMANCKKIRADERGRAFQGKLSEIDISLLRVEAHHLWSPQLDQFEVRRKILYMEELRPEISQPNDFNHRIRSDSSDSLRQWGKGSERQFAADKDKSSLVRLSGENLVSAIAHAHNLDRGGERRERVAATHHPYTNNNTSISINQDQIPVRQSDLDQNAADILKNKIVLQNNGNTERSELTEIEIRPALSRTTSPKTSTPPSLNGSGVASIEVNTSSFNINLLAHVSPKIVSRMPILLIEQVFDEEMEEKGLEEKDFFTLKEFLRSAEFQAMEDSLTRSCDQFQIQTMDSCARSCDLYFDDEEKEEEKKKVKPPVSGKKSKKSKKLPRKKNLVLLAPQKTILKPARDTELYIDPVYYDSLKKPNMYTFRRPDYVEPIQTKRVVFSKESVDIVKALRARDGDVRISLYGKLTKYFLGLG